MEHDEMDKQQLLGWMIMLVYLVERKVCPNYDVVNC